MARRREVSKQIELTFSDSNEVVSLRDQIRILQASNHRLELQTNSLMAENERLSQLL